MREGRYSFLWQSSGKPGLGGTAMRESSQNGRTRITNPANVAVRGLSIASTGAKNLSSAGMFRETPSIPSSSGIIKTADCCLRARCETALFRTPGVRYQPN